MFDCTMIFMGYMWFRFGLLAKNSNSTLPYYTMMSIGICHLVGVGIVYIYLLFYDVIRTTQVNFLSIIVMTIMLLLLLVSLYFDFFNKKSSGSLTKAKPKIPFDVTLAVLGYISCALIYWLINE